MTYHSFNEFRSFNKAYEKALSLKHTGHLENYLRMSIVHSNEYSHDFTSESHAKSLSKTIQAHEHVILQPNHTNPMLNIQKHEAHINSPSHHSLDLMK